MVYARLNLEGFLPVDVDAVNKLKEKIICEYQTLLKFTSKGYKPDYTFIMNEISLVDLITKNLVTVEESTSTLQYYLNNKWQVTF